MTSAYDNNQVTGGELDPYNAQAIEDLGMGQPMPTMGLTWVLGMIALTTGCLLLSIVNAQFGPVVLALAFLLAGVVILKLPGLGGLYVLRAFVLSFCICVLIAGLCQVYAYVIFGELQTTPDTRVLYPLAAEGLGPQTMGELMKAGITYPLAAKAWQALYSVCRVVRLGSGPWIGVIMNCFIVGMSASITVRAGRYVFGPDDRRLRRIGTMFALCGSFWLFGALFLRDCFALIINVIALWAFVRMLSLPSAKNLLILIGAVLLAALAMYYIRQKTIPLFILLAFLGAVSWSRRRRAGIMGLVLPMLAVLAVILLYPLISSFAGTTVKTVLYEAGKYGAGEVATLETKSLGARYVLAQPLPIRVVVGSLSMLIYPVPIWVNFNLHMREYHWLKGFNGLFIMWIMPAAFVGLASAFKWAFQGGRNVPPFCFLTLYMIFGLASVAATSLETRHAALVFPVILLLAAIPDRTEPGTRSRIRNTAVVWFGLIGAGHIVWAVQKAFLV